MKTNLKTILLKHPYNLFLLAAILLFLFSFFTLGQSLDFMLHDTYFIISTISFFWFLTFANLFIWTIYRLSHKILWTKFLTWIHVLTSFSVLLLLLAVSYLANRTVGLKREYVTIEVLETEQQIHTVIIVIMTIVFVGGQIAFITNLVGGLIKKLLTKT